MLDINVDKIIFIAREAGSEILAVYENGCRLIEYKEDKSPITLADKRSHDFITSRLREFYPNIPIISEEQKEIPYNKRKNWEFFWLVDPLDGTKEFVKRNGEFTVNIALIYKDLPVLGVIYAPVKNELFYATNGHGTYKIGSDGNETKLEVAGESADNKIVIVTSRSHRTEEVQDYINRLERAGRKVEEVAVGSSLKFCAIAENRAHIYPRFGPTKEWDTAAGHIIVEEAGGIVRDVTTNETLKYNKLVLVNNNFIVQGLSDRQL